ncbi:protein crumbs homolog 2-like [Mya arenaria]|uniref:protein crumbs homolog 2-like n=1 Tax=Mya arenaria TaxID=6604 RepID=UPI0022E6A3FB|nr:protein crumbs homolog 2-like [Mya arenaria]
MTSLCVLKIKLLLVVLLFDFSIVQSISVANEEENLYKHPESPGATVIKLKQGVYFPEDPCSSNPCLHGGLCRPHPILPPPAFSCACALGRKGKICSEYIQSCDLQPCLTRSDCIATPDGALCICDTADFGHFCLIQMEHKTEWQRLREVVTVRTVHTLTIAAIIVSSLEGILCLCSIVHCCRVARTRHKHREMFLSVVDRGEVPAIMPPDWLDVHRHYMAVSTCRNPEPLPVTYSPESSGDRKHRRHGKHRKERPEKEYEEKSDRKSKKERRRSRDI